MKKFGFRRSPQRKLNNVRYINSTILQNNKYNLWGKKQKQKCMGQIVGKYLLPTTQQFGLVERGEIPNPQQTSNDKTNACFMISDCGALVTSTDRLYGPPCSHIDRWYAAGVGQEFDNNRSGPVWCINKIRQHVWLPLGWHILCFISALGGERWTSPARARRLNLGSTRNFPGRYLHPGLSLSRGPRSIVAWAVVI